jgi:predicted NUDIX family phosphoesterase
MKHDPKEFAGNAYLWLAAEALTRARRPLTPLEMLDVAREDGFVPQHLFGATMHKTLAARLSEHIRRYSQSSKFFRTAPATYYLHSLAEEPNTPEEFRNVYIGNLRSKSIRKENVLVAPRGELQRRVYGEYVTFDEDTFSDMYRTICRFVDRRRAEDDHGLKQFVTFTLVVRGPKILIYRRGKFTTTSDELRGQLSVGFGGHVNDQDFNLFNRGSDAFRANATRELQEELFLDEYYREQYEAMDRASVLGYINVDDSPDARHHVAVLIAFKHKDDSVPKKGELSINQLEWLDLSTPLNDLSDFDLWSGMILRNLYEGNIKLDMGSNVGNQEAA